MAKVGEGDPRWIVQDRQDGTNCNKWHWTEKDISEFLKSRINELVENQTIVDTPILRCKTLSMDKVEGDGTVFNRKGKVSFLLDLQFSVTWEGDILDDEGKTIANAKGKLTVPELEHDSNCEKLQVDVTCSGGSEAAKLVQLMQSEGRAWLRSKCTTLLAEVKAGHGVQDKKAAITTNPTAKKPQETKKAVVDQTEFAYTIEWRAPPKEMWDALTHEGRVSAYTRSSVKLQCEVGGEFAFLNGTINGTYTEVEPLKKLGMNWRLSDWAEGHFSPVTITLESFESGTTVLKLQQTNVPTSELERTQQGWKSNFWDPIKMLFGYGYEMK
mmetsp:Transcript_90410/g.156610  ORF Transcript_90410/g.156610 Transcript_90410/m.156610 type:complete len:327 (-) Transcript_90410:962-1942(-)